MWPRMNFEYDDAKPVIQQLLPITSTSTDETYKKRYWDYLYEPTKKIIRNIVKPLC